MKASLQQIETFYWVARLGGFRAAARHLHLTQPTISARVQELERALGITLFERGQYRAELTLAGRDALTHAEKMLRLADEFEKVGQRRDPMRGLLRLGANESTAMIGLTQLLTRLKANYPELQIELTIDVGATLSRKLNARELDIAILTDPISAPHVVDEALGQVELRWLASSRLVSPQAMLAPADVAALPIVMMPPPSTLYKVALEWFRDGGMELEAFGSCNSMSLIAQLVAAGHAVSLLPLSIVGAELAGGVMQVLPTTPVIPPRTYFASYLREAEGYGAIARMAREVLTQSGLLMRPA